MLDSWTDLDTRKTIEEFVFRVTDASSPQWLPPAERVAVFDNDGTLWCEKPMPVELGFILKRMAAMAEADPTLRARQPWKAAYEKDYGWLGSVITRHYLGDDNDVKVLMAGVLGAFRDLSVEDYARAADSFLDSARHPAFHRRLRDCAYAPMIELLRYLEQHGFTSYIASGGDRDFMRVIAEEIYGIPAERVIGSSTALCYRDDGDCGTVAYLAKPDVFDDGPAKPVRIWSRIGRRPIVAFGNSNGDIQMLQFAGGAGLPALRLLLLHDDASREVAYTAGAEKSLELAKAHGWTIVSMKNDWTTVFQS
jgi:phosphoglycolate phosphatase-like HAD superfamily hydrolase